MPATATPKTCRRCSGTGYLPQFAHVANGKCVACGGKGTGSTRYTAAMRADDDARGAAESAAREAEEADERAARAARRAARGLSPR